MNLFWLLACFAGVLLVSSAFGILIWVFGWYVIALLGGAFVIFVVLSLLRDWLADLRQVSR